ncbi:MAG: iron-sulfur cluster assembly accessory protein [Myxococcota bacterium]
MESVTTSEPPISLTEKAIQMGKKQLREAGGGLGLRLGVKGGGCSGYYYVYEVADKVRSRDMSFDFGGLNIIVDHRSLELLKGGVLDWEQKLLGYGFKWQNPNATGDCGCGASFTTD